jgi:hypothetical protein
MKNRSAIRRDEQYELFDALRDLRIDDLHQCIYAVFLNI